MLSLTRHQIPEIETAAPKLETLEKSDGCLDYVWPRAPGHEPEPSAILAQNPAKATGCPCNKYRHHVLLLKPPSNLR